MDILSPKYIFPLEYFSSHRLYGFTGFNSLTYKCTNTSSKCFKSDII